MDNNFLAWVNNSNRICNGLAEILDVSLVRNFEKNNRITYVCWGSL